jgi:hypothetical protein
VRELNACRTGFLALRRRNRSRKSEKRMLGPKREDIYITGGWRKLHNEIESFGFWSDIIITVIK